MCRADEPPLTTDGRAQNDEPGRYPCQAPARGMEVSDALFFLLSLSRLHALCVRTSPDDATAIKSRDVDVEWTRVVPSVCDPNRP